jgi:hypothetical protein
MGDGRWEMGDGRWEMEATDYDGAWKEALERYFRPFVEVCFPTVAAGIDWSAAIEFLDQELQAVVRDAELGKQRADKLVKVQRQDGVEEWLLVHVEVQGQRDPDLPRRMYRYHHRIEDRYECPVVSLAVLADANPEWRRGPYVAGTWGCEVRFQYPTCKLLDLAEECRQLEQARNPAAVVIAAHLGAQATAGDLPERYRIKWGLTRGLYERGYDKQDILELYRLLDWLLILPDELEVAFRKALVDYEEKHNMPHVTSIERIGWQEGRQEGRLLALQETVLEILGARFGEVPYAVRQHVLTLRDERELKLELRQAALVQTLKEFSGSIHQ